MEQQPPEKLTAATTWLGWRQVVVPGESDEALKAHLNHWNALYPNVETDPILSDLVREAAFSSWMLLRTQHEYDATLANLYLTPNDAWTPKEHGTFQLRERYLNTAQRRLNRHRSDILQYQASRRSQAREDRAANTYTAAEKANRKETDPLPRVPRKTNDTVIQTAFIRQRDGQTETFLAPDNENLLEHISQFRYDTTVIYRCVSFENRYVPPEYAAFAERASRLSTEKEESIGLPITFQSLRIAVEREKEFGGHVRDWPDLLAHDDSCIKLKDQEAWIVKKITTKKTGPGGRSMV